MGSAEVEDAGSNADIMAAECSEELMSSMDLGAG